MSDKEEIRGLTYCSFALQSRCLGVVILKGRHDVATAAKKCLRLGINPGGELVAVACSSNDPDIPSKIFEAMAANTHRLIPAEEARVLFEAKSLRELAEEEKQHE